MPVGGRRRKGCRHDNPDSSIGLKLSKFTRQQRRPQPRATPFSTPAGAPVGKPSAVPLNTAFRSLCRVPMFTAADAGSFAAADAPAFSSFRTMPRTSFNTWPPARPCNRLRKRSILARRDPSTPHSAQVPACLSAIDPSWTQQPSRDHLWPGSILPKKAPSHTCPTCFACRAKLDLYWTERVRPAPHLPFPGHHLPLEPCHPLTAAILVAQECSSVNGGCPMLPLSTDQSGERRAATRCICHQHCLVRFDRMHLDGQAGCIGAEGFITDFSACSVGLLLRPATPSGAALEIAPLGSAEAPLPLAHVVRCIPVDGRWRHGCSLERRLSEEELSCLLV
jgi:hypothetical protein